MKNQASYIEKLGNTMSAFGVGKWQQPKNEKVLRSLGGTQISFWRGVRREVWWNSYHPYPRIFQPQKKKKKKADFTGFFRKLGPTSIYLFIFFFDKMDPISVAHPCTVTVYLNM